MLLRNRLLICVSMVACLLNGGRCFGGDPYLEIHKVRIINLSGYPVAVRLYQKKNDYIVSEEQINNDGQGKWVSVASGTYYIIARYGPIPGASAKQAYRYFKGADFTLKAPPGLFVEASVKLFFESLDVTVQPSSP